MPEHTDADTNQRAAPSTGSMKRFLAITGVSVVLGVGVSLAIHHTGAMESVASAQPEEEQVRGVDAFNIEPLLIERDQIRVLLHRDAIPALTDPKTQSVSEGAAWLEPSDRVVVVGSGAEAVASPIRVLNWHEIINMTVGGEPIAVTYCPLCDSASVFNRRVQHEDAEMVLEFGTSGALYNSNVLMYDRTTFGLWSQVGLRCVSGPLAGTRLEHRPLRMMTFGEFRLRHADGKVVANNTGVRRNYDLNPYADYFADPDRLLVPVEGMGDELPRKTLGMGVFAQGKAWFVSAGALADGYTLQTPAGPVEAVANEAGVEVTNAPRGVQTVQTFYYAWSAFHPQTEVVATDEERAQAGAAGDDQTGE